MTPKRCEIWLIECEPQRGSEIQKTRPCVVINIEEISVYPLRIVLPIREYKDHHMSNFQMIPILPTTKNGLSKKSSIDALQIKSFDLSRFKKRLGKITEQELTKALNAHIICIGYQEQS